MKENKPSLPQLFFSVLKISAFTFGGGYVIVPLMRKRFAEELHWVTDEEMLNMIAIAQSAPGPIAVNSSIMLGYRLFSVKGALVAALGTSLPPLVVLTVISAFYEAFKSNRVISALLEGMRAGVTAVIADVVWTMAANIFKKKKPMPIVLMIAAFLAVALLKINIVLVLAACGFIGFLDGMLRRERKA